MSYDISNRVINSRSRALARLQEELEDVRRGEFLKRLDAADIETTDWEAHFIEGFLSAAIPAAWWTEGRRKSADIMMGNYGGQI